MLTVNRNELARAITIVRRTVRKSKTLPTLQGIRVTQAEGGSSALVIESFDLECATSIRVDADGTLGEGCVVPAKQLAAVVKTATGDELSISSPAGEQTLKVSGESGTASIAGYALDDFPVLPFFESTPTGIAILGTLHEHDAIESESYRSEQIRDVIDLVLYAASADVTRYNLNTVLIDVENDRPRWVATDGHRAAIAEFGVCYATVGKGQTMPASFVRALGLLIGKRPKHNWVMISCAKRARWIEATYNGIRIAGRLVDAEFPNYRQVIPKTNGRNASFPIGAFAAAVDQAKATSTGRCFPVALEFVEDGVVFKTAGSESFVPARVSADAQGMRIGFNSTYLMGVAKAFGTVAPGSTVQMDLKDELSPVVIHATDSAVAGSSQAIVMPLRV